ncbi:hypothetical protein JCM3775_003057 [Rhodotorula graminis]
MSASAAPGAIPSVLAHPPTFAPAPSPAPTAPLGQVRCSQCKKDKPLDEYPLRLINLKPYQVCNAHAWYWTAAKQHSQWAPARYTAFHHVCDEVLMGGPSAQGKWLVEGAFEDRSRFVEQVAAAGNWTAQELMTRPTKAKGDAIPSPTWVYSLSPASTSTAPAPELLKLQLWHHAAASAFTITLKSDDAAQEPGPWAKKGRVRRSVAQQAPSVPRAALTLPQPPSSSASTTASPGAALGSTAATPPEDRNRQLATFAALADAAGAAARDRDREQMPPPPVPSARPAKRARRVEPQLVSPTPTSLGSSGLITPFSAAHAEWSHFLSFPTLVQQPQNASAPPAQQPQQAQQRDFPLDPLLLSSLVQPSPSSTSIRHAPAAPSPAHNSRPLSLAELLSSAIFEPPIIDLPPRPPPTHHVRAHSHAPAPRSGREFDAAVADALGATPDALDGDESGEGDSDDEGRGYYEDSIPDESSADDDEEEEEGAEGAGDGADGASVSSFFESSAEETDYGSDDENALSDDEGEDNWLEGFAAQQMGLGPRRGAERGRQGASEEDEGNDELSEGEGRVAQPARPTRASTAARRRGTQQGTTAAGAAVDEDEVDELDSPSSGGDER